MSSRQHTIMRQPVRFSRSTNDLWSVRPQNDASIDPVVRSLKSSSKPLPMDLLAGILSANQSGCSRPVHLSVEHPGVSRCLSILSRNPRLKLRDLVDVSGLSLRGLHKAFRTHLGCTPGAILVMLRLWNAYDLLANSSLPVAEIALRCGYRNGNSLYVALRRYLGITPSRVRRQSPSHDRVDVKRHCRIRTVPLPLNSWKDANSLCQATATGS